MAARVFRAASGIIVCGCIVLVDLVTPGADGVVERLCNGKAILPNGLEGCRERHINARGIIAFICQPELQSECSVRGWTFTTRDRRAIYTQPRIY